MAWRKLEDGICEYFVSLQSGETYTSIFALFLKDLLCQGLLHGRGAKGKAGAEGLREILSSGYVVFLECAFDGLVGDQFVAFDVEVCWSKLNRMLFLLSIERDFGL